MKLSLLIAFASLLTFVTISDVPVVSASGCDGMNMQLGTQLCSDLTQTGGNCNGSIDADCNDQAGNCHTEHTPTGDKTVCTGEHCTLWSGSCVVG